MSDTQLDAGVAPGAAPPVSVVVRRTLKVGARADYEGWLRRVTPVLAGFDGHMGTTALWLSYREVVLVFRFATLDALLVWERSEQRATLLAEVAPLTEGEVGFERLTGLEAWFRMPSAGPGAGPPPRWKMALLTWIAAFPTIQLLNAVLGPVLAPLPTLVRGAVVGAVLVFLLTWVIMPRLAAFAAPWLASRVPTDTTRREATFPVAPAAVHALLADPRRLTEIHPLIDSVNVSFDGEEAGARVIRFTVVELVPIGPFRLRNHLKGEARWASLAEIELTGWSRPGVVVRSHWRLDAVGAGTHAVQRVDVEAPWWVAGFVFRTARAAHAALLDRVRARLAK
jgi:antibiotic biosynthesis monooxygenase (ABM) superfamily enzyme